MDSVVRGREPGSDHGEGSTPFLLRAFNAVKLVLELVFDEYWAGRADASLIINQASGFALEAEQQISLLGRAF